MLNIYDYIKVKQQIKEQGSFGLGGAVRKREGDFVYPEVVIVKYTDYRQKLKIKRRIP